MKLNPRISYETRLRLDKEFETTLKPLISPLRWSEQLTFRRGKGWLKSIRTALGISSRQMAKFMDKNNSEILALERREELGTISLQSLDLAARALNCHLVYAIVPNRHHSLDAMLSERAEKVAEGVVKKTAHSMSLENQKIDEQTQRQQIFDLAHELKHKLGPRIWRDE